MQTRVTTDIEEIVLRWLDKHNIDYLFQTSLAGGFYALGGAVVDVIISARRLAWRIQGEYFHRGVVPSGRDQVQRELLTGLGYTVVDLWQTDIEERLNETMLKALRGEEMLR